MAVVGDGDGATDEGRADGAGDEVDRAPRKPVEHLEWTGEIELGQVIKVDLFEEGQRVDACGTSKGRGYTGVVKRHNFKIKKRTHGTHEYFRHPGSIGAGAWPGRVFKGGKQAGQHGNARTTVLNLEVVRVDEERNLLFVRGAVPGHRNGLVRVRPAIK